MFYGAHNSALNRRITAQADRTLKGATPTDLPVEQPTTFEFVINVRAAHAFGLTFPPHVLAQVSEIVG